MAAGPRQEKSPRIRKLETDKGPGSKVISGGDKKEAKVAGGSRSAALRPFFSGLAKIGRVLGKILGWLVPRYFLNAWREVRQVTWPSRGESWRLTSAVFIFAIIFGALVASVDKGLDEIFKKVIIK